MPATSTRPCASVIETEDRVRDVGAARADQPGDADHLARVHREADVREAAWARQLRDAQHLAAAGLRRRPSGRYSSSRRPIIRCTSAASSSASTGLVATWRPSRSTVMVSHRRKISCIRCDTNTHVTLARAQAIEQRVEMFGLVLGQAAGRLVEDDHARAAADRGGDLHHLLLGDRQLTDQAPHVDGRLDRGQQRAGALLHLARETNDPAPGQIAEAEVLGDRQVLAERQLLVDDADSRRAARRADLRSCTTRPSTAISPASGCSMPASSLPSVLLPAPFSPHSA